MSFKDTRYYRYCPICSDKLIGTDDGLEVYESLQDQIENPEFPDDPTCNCTLCGEECTVDEAKAIVAKGEPTLHKV